MQTCISSYRLLARLAAAFFFGLSPHCWSLSSLLFSLLSAGLSSHCWSLSSLLPFPSALSIFSLSFTSYLALLVAFPLFSISDSSPRFPSFSNKVATTFLFTYMGVPCIYYGDEVCQNTTLCEAESVILVFYLRVSRFWRGVKVCFSCLCSCALELSLIAVWYSCLFLRVGIIVGGSPLFLPPFLHPALLKTPPRLVWKDAATPTAGAAFLGMTRARGTLSFSTGTRS